MKDVRERDEDDRDDDRNGDDRRGEHTSAARLYGVASTNCDQKCVVLPRRTMSSIPPSRLRVWEL